MTKLGNGRSAIRWGWVLAAAVVVTFLVVATAANVDAGRCRRALSALDPVMVPLRQGSFRLLALLYGWRWWIAGAVGLLALAVGVRAAARRAAGPLVLALAAAALATCGEAAFSADRPRSGTLLLIAALVLAASFGALRPLRRLPGFLDPPDALPEDAPWTWWEAAWVLGLTALGLVLRGWALTELPGEFDDEAINTMNASYTWYGFRDHAAGEFLGSSVGFLHLPTLRLAYALFGPSMTAVRLTSLAWGTAAIPLFYTLARRLAGRRPALFGTLIFLCAPEQLFWSRCDNGHFPALTVMALVTGHLCLSLLRSFSPRAALALGLWLPVCRIGYASGYVLFLLPALLWLHVVLVERLRQWRRLFVAGAALAGGALLWFLVPTFMVMVAPHGRARLVNPLVMHGGTLWRHHIAASVTSGDLVKLQVARVSKHLLDAGAGLVDNVRVASHWVTRYAVDNRHASSITAGLAVLALLGLGMLLGQPRSRVTALLVSWFGLGLLPAVLSDSPEARRLADIFPMLPLLATLFAAALVRTARAELGGPSARVLGTVVSLAGVLTAAAGAASHLALPLHVPRRAREACFSRPVLDRSDTVLHNFFMQMGHNLALHGLSRAASAHDPLCLQYVNAPEWTGAALQPSCSYTDVTYKTILPDEERARRAESHVPRRIAFLLDLTAVGPRTPALLTSLYPGARPRHTEGVGPQLWSVEITAEDVKRLEAPPPKPGATTHGALLVRFEGWRALSLDPPCPGARLELDGAPAGDVRPMLPGVYPVSLALPASCAPPRLLWTPYGAGGPRKPEDAGPLFVTRVAEIAEARAGPVALEPGWGEPRPALALTAGLALDLGRDERGGLHVLAFEDGGWTLRSRSPGAPERTARPDVLKDISAGALGVGADGSCVVAGGTQVEVYRDGTRLARWTTGFATDVAVRGDRVYVAQPNQRCIAVFRLDGSRVATLKEGLPGLVLPIGLAAGPRGVLVVTQSGGPLLVIEDADGSPRVAASFHPDYAAIPQATELAGVALDGDDRIFLPHHATVTPLVYDLSGRRVLASRPGDDLSTKGLGEVTRVASAPDGLYVLEPLARTLRLVPRLAR